MHARRRVAAVLRRVKGVALPSRAADPLATVIEAFGRARPEARFIQVGSNDGGLFDPLRRQIEARRWTGVMIEPVPYVFERLHGRHGANPRVALENTAIAERDGTRTMYYLPETSDPALPRWYDQLASFRKDIVLEHRRAIPDIEERLAEIEVPCVTFDGLCARHGIEEVDLIHIDTEGYDFEIVKLIDLDRLHPTIVMFEHYHMDRATWEACVDLLRSHGYEDISNGMDTLCLLVDELDGAPADLASTWRALRADARWVAPPAWA